MRVEYIETLASKAVPNDDSRYLWFDSTGIIGAQEFLTYDEAKDFIGWRFDSWLKPVTFARLEVLDEAC